jgi:hypothetical protein
MLDGRSNFWLVDLVEGPLMPTGMTCIGDRGVRDRRLLIGRNCFGQLWKKKLKKAQISFLPGFR